MKAITYIKQNLSHLNPQILNQLLENEGSILTEELWAYLSETSRNTNPAILWSEFGIDVDESGDSRPIDWYIWLEDYNTHVGLNYESINSEYPCGKYITEMDAETGECRTIFVEEWPSPIESNFLITIDENEGEYIANVSRLDGTTWTVSGANGYFPEPEITSQQEV